MIKSIAIHLPQFYPFAENDEWWGKGFTEWTNVTKAKPLFEGHYQPHLPTDLGFYDLRLEEARIAQAELAREYGIDGFCYYHYWFNGKRIMNKPLDDMIRTKTPNFPYMLCWANENWTRRWDGMDAEILIEQTYGHQDDITHMEFLCSNFFNDPRYIRVNGKPFFVVYRPSLFPDIKNTLIQWREVARKMGIGELYLGYMQSFNYKDDPSVAGFDCAIEFQPDFSSVPTPERLPIKDKIKYKLKISKSAYHLNFIYSYSKYVKRFIENWKVKRNIYPSIFPMWDNASRRNGGATIFKDSTPLIYQEWLEHIIKLYKEEKSDMDKYIFINAWNEWAEGNHLEPCQEWGRKYLEATKNALDSI
jgi:lipopolysaccharide biosynthesis protein